MSRYRRKKTVPFRSAGELDAMAAAGAVVGRALVAVRDAARVGVSTLELDEVAETVIRDAGAIPSFKGYHGFPGSICSSVNEVVVHGIPDRSTVLALGDLVSIDCGAILDGWHGDSAWTFGVGELSQADDDLSEATRLSLEAGIEAMVEAENSDLPELVRDECRDILRQIAEKTQRIEAKAQQISALAKITDTARRLQTMPGVGPMSALAVEAFAPPMESFRRGRDFAAWLGLVPRQATTGGKPKLLGITKRGSRYLRKMLIQGARSAMPTLAKANTAIGAWLRALLVRTHPNIAVVALAAKMARTVWALLRHGRNYEAVPQAAG